MSSESRALERAARADFVAGLRAMADLFEKDGVNRLPLPQYGLTVQLSAEVKQEIPGVSPWNAPTDQEASLKKLRRIVSGMGRGRKDKNFTDTTFSCVKDLGGGVRLRVDAGRQIVCKPVKTGRTIVHPAQVYSTPERVEEEVEWVCDETLLGERKAA